MAGRSINLFQFNQKFCEIIGVKLPEANPNGHIFNLINLGVVISLTVFIMPTAAYLLYDANSMAEYGIVFYILICGIEGMVVYFITIWEIDEILEFIENCEEFIEKSE